MFQRFRILPLLILVAVAMLTLKLGTIWQDMMGVRSAVEARVAGAAEENTADPEKAEGAQADAAKAGAEGAPAPDGKAPPDAPTAAPAIVDTSFDPRELSQSEVRLLQALADRRKALDAREFGLNQREALLKAAEQRLTDKQAEFLVMRDEIKLLLDQLDEQEKKRINSLVKLYENMKPKDAARILNELELGVLMSVVRRMNVRRLAPVLAAMEPDKARAVTRSLAKREKSQKDAVDRFNGSIAERK